MQPASHTHPSSMLRLLDRLRASWLVRNLALFVAAGAIISAGLMYYELTRSHTPLGTDLEKILGLGFATLTFLLLLTAIISWKLFSLWVARRRGSVGSRLQTRIIIVFSLISITPTIIVAFFSLFFFNKGIQAWFDEQVSTALEQSVLVAESYFSEHANILRADVLAMAHDLSRQSLEFRRSPKLFKQIVSSQTRLRNLTEAVIFQGKQLLAQSDLSFTLAMEFRELTPDVLEQAAEGEVVVLTSENDDRVRALVKLNNFFDTYLLVGRLIDAKILNHVENAKGSAAKYQKLKANISSLQIHFSFVFIAVALLLLLAAIWAGIVFAGKLSEPITSIIQATERVKAGDLSTHISEQTDNDDELGTLARAFNRMTGQLGKQRNELIDANRQLDARRRFIEAVFSGVSAAVLALDKTKRITLFNRSTLTLFSSRSYELEGRHFADILPEIGDLLDKIATDNKHVVQDEISIIRNQRKLTLLVRIVAEEFSDEIEGYVITLDDITELQTAQRSAAWADVARRIAHEIKNPLTPIHLATERLKRKYIKEIQSDPETFEKYTDTISRHIEDIATIVDEFVSFARIPAPVFRQENIHTLISDSIFSEQTVHPEITYRLETPQHPVFIRADRSQLSQVFGNLLKNAGEAVISTHKNDTDGAIILRLQETENITITMEDNGCGFPPELLDRITEPYVTTREKGTGLGLAIVKKIITDHDGTLFLENILTADGTVRGARVILTFPHG